MQLIRLITSRSLRNWGVVYAAVFTSFLLIPRAANAACGDYLHVNGRSPETIHSISAPAADSNDSENNGGPHRPCHGPGCSNGSFPPPVPVPSVIVSIERWAVATADIVPTHVSSNNALAGPSDPIVEGFRLSILRPPR